MSNPKVKDLKSINDFYYKMLRRKFHLLVYINIMSFLKHPFVYMFLLIKSKYSYPILIRNEMLLVTILDFPFNIHDTPWYEYNKLNVGYCRLIIKEDGSLFNSEESIAVINRCKDLLENHLKENKKGGYNYIPPTPNGYKGPSEWEILKEKYKNNGRVL